MSTAKRKNKLFHAVVILGAGMTGGAAAIACGGSSDDTSTCTGPSCGYAQIAYNPDAYAHISNDASGDAYAHIGFNGDAQVSDSPMDAADATDALPDADDAG